MRTLPKKFIYVFLIVILVLLLYNTVNINTNSERLVVSYEDNSLGDQTINSGTEYKNGSVDSMKYILQWTSPKNVPFVYMGNGQEGFEERNCPFTNCYVTANKSYLNDITQFDVIAFAGPEVVRLYNLPKARSPHQKYAFATIESSDNYPICSNRYDGYFNWTWTFRLDSEVRWGYLTVRDKNNKIVGPNKVMHWMKVEEMDPINNELREQLKSKTKAAAWFVSNCYTRSKREVYVKDLRKALAKYKLDVDVYGNCGNMKCSRGNEAECDDIIKKTYYFYLSFENSYSEDYVTEKLLHALENNAIPVVYGSANYSRFMPDGIYLNARELSASDIAAKMYELINDSEKYSDYFKWQNHYSYHRKAASTETDPYCLFCTILNDEEKVKKTTIYRDFRSWWDPPNRC